MEQNLTPTGATAGVDLDKLTRYSLSKQDHNMWIHGSGEYVKFSELKAILARRARRAQPRVAEQADERVLRAFDALDGMGFTYDDEIGWLAPAPATPAAPSDGNIGWAHDLQKRLMVADDQGDDELHNLLGEVACCLAALTGRPDTTLTPPAPMSQAPAATDQPSAGQVDERTAFEAWYSPKFGVPKRLGDSDQYQMSSAQGAWQAWQARASLTPTAPQAASQQAEPIARVTRVFGAERAEIMGYREGALSVNMPLFSAPQAATTASADVSVINYGNPVDNSAATTASAPETIEQRLRRIRDFGDEQLTNDVQTGQIPIHKAIERIEAAATTASASAIKTWQERLNAEGLYEEGGRLFGGWTAVTMARDAEIADLRAALARAPLPDLTAEQIAAGAAVLGDDGKPIGRNVAIMVADAMRDARAPLPAQAGKVTPAATASAFREQREAIHREAEQCQIAQAVDVARDAARLDYLDKNAVIAAPQQSIREAIDAAMSRTNTSGGSDAS